MGAGLNEDFGKCTDEEKRAGDEDTWKGTCVDARRQWRMRFRGREAHTLLEMSKWGLSVTGRGREVLLSLFHQLYHQD